MTKKIISEEKTSSNLAKIDSKKTPTSRSTSQPASSEILRKTKRLNTSQKKSSKTANENNENYIDQEQEQELMEVDNNTKNKINHDQNEIYNHFSLVIELNGIRIFKCGLCSKVRFIYSYLNKKF